MPGNNDSMITSKLHQTYENHAFYSERFLSIFWVFKQKPNYLNPPSRNLVVKNFHMLIIE